jgi:hypothetical protein
MYICQITKRHSEKGQKLNKLVIATRDRVYTKKVRNEETNRWEDVEIGRGWEIVREINVSAQGLEQWNSWSQEEKDLFIKQFRG